MNDKKNGWHVCVIEGCIETTSFKAHGWLRIYVDKWYTVNNERCWNAFNTSRHLWLY